MKGPTQDKRVPSGLCTPHPAGALKALSPVRSGSGFFLLPFTTEKKASTKEKTAQTKEKKALTKELAAMAEGCFGQAPVSLGEAV